MKTRTYSVFIVWYEGLDYDCRLEGPATPALSTLLKRFKAEYGIPITRANTFDGSKAYIEAEMAAEERLDGEDYCGMYWQHKFVDWVIKNHGFKRVEDDVFYVG